jgi:hypothetical protein
MPGVSAWVSFLQLVNFALTGATVVAIYRRGLARKYRILFAYLLFVTAQSGLLLAPSRDGTLYFWTYLATAPVTWVFYILLVHELFRLAFQSYPGIERLGRWVFHGSMAVAVLISAAINGAAGTATGTSSWVLPYAILIGRSIGMVVVLVLLGLLAFVIWSPTPLSRNLVVHTFAFSIYHINGTLGYFLLTYAPDGSREYANLLLVGITAVALAIWLVFLKPAGETVLVRLNRWTEVSESRLLGQLDGYNSVLTRSSRK